MSKNDTKEQKHVSDLSSKYEESLHPKEKRNSNDSNKETSNSNDDKDASNGTNIKKNNGDHDKEQPSTEMLSISEITDGITEKLNSVLMEMNKSDKEMEKVLVGIDSRLDELGNAFK
ncbi:hypothetical protein HII12_000081 [Brettanomyces bruxellensis]|mgnify:CR=1 FL=1|uniref:DEBR0S1_07426g1_1 n=1 Tax=Dekkera bruxellensis TaxID=5007 RepID=A0A7D9CW38_DEKBR|nr:hypothetical protein HII12_000081 [Brettanomyces bruxellensis]VUG16090.1 DEBR0S1_07426g1_1 [Brettanomyces bruxellensis]